MALFTSSARYPRHMAQVYLLLVVFPLAMAATMGDLFRIKAGTTNGGCDPYIGRLQSYLDDTQTFVTAGLQAADQNGFSTNPYARRNLLNFFGVRARRQAGILQPQISDPGQPTLDIVRTFYQDLDDFLNLRTSNEKVAALTGDKKPWLFCDSTWLEETETVYEDDGSILLGENGQDPPTIRNLVLDDDNREFFDVYQTPAGNTNPDNWDVYAYWSSDIQDYFAVDRSGRYEPDTTLPGNPRNWCAGDAEDGPANTGNNNWRFAVTSVTMDQPTITLCLASFSNQAAPWETIADMAADPNSNQVGQNLDNQMPRLATIMHEMVHLVQGQIIGNIKNTPDVGTKSQQCLQLIQNGKYVDARTNPESYPFMSLSYWLTQNRRGGGANAPFIDWSKDVSENWN